MIVGDPMTSACREPRQTPEGSWGNRPRAASLQRVEERIRCYFLRDGHISAVELLTDASDEAAIEAAQQVFQKYKGRCSGFEVWDRARFVYRYPPAPQNDTRETAIECNEEDRS